ncbi:WD repeat-containing protein 63-like [Anneissia japonica]|uniref:WD repeat-containing protein 63-like n=1 Tax=Anneissia japonica TaxID=1529436 RepID=UPI001425BA33|nr:WD repeat-containing protein 63-like [Anneissia japonica]
MATSFGRYDDRRRQAAQSGRKHCYTMASNEDNAPTPQTEVKQAENDSRPTSRAKSGTLKPQGGENVPSRQGSAKASKPSKGKKTSQSKGKAKKTEVEDQPSKDAAEDKDSLPENVIPIFLSSKSQEIFHCATDEEVTMEDPFKLISKEDIIQDLKMRAGVCDFAPIKQKILDYPGDEILVVYDADYKHGQNFIVALTEEAKEKLMRPSTADQVDGEEGEGGTEGQQQEGGDEEVDLTVYTYVPPEPKEWVSYGSEHDIEEESIQEKREKISFTLRRIRREFGAPIKFSDRGPDDAKDGYIECTPYEDKNFSVKKIELDKSVQAIGETTDSGSQTEWKHPCNKFTQYAPRQFDEEEKNKHLQSHQLKNFIQNVTPRFQLALQQNEIMDVFNNDWTVLADEDSSFGSKSDNHLKEYQSFTDMQFSKEKTITSIEWHPSIKGVIAVACAERMLFDERIDNASKVLMAPSLILIWSFSDPIHPQILLEAPDDIFCFKFNPTDSNVIAGGCINGQVVLWDISKHVDRLKNSQRGKQPKKNTMTSLPGFEDENTDKTPIIRYCAVSAIEHSHKTAIADIQWVPDHIELTRMGILCENRQQICCQILTASTDGTVAIWDTRPPKGAAPVDDNKSNGPLGVPSTFKHIDLTWKPVIKIPISRIEGNGDYAVTCVSIQERQGDRTILEKQSRDIEKRESNTGIGSSMRGGSAKEKKPLEGATSKFFVGTEDGELVYADWKLEKDVDSGRLQPPKPEFAKLFHDQCITTLQRSPFFKEYLLIVGGWNFSIWKEGEMSEPLLCSAASAKKLTAGFWSPSRPSVFYIARADGNIDVWDLLDRTHEPSLSQNISAASITSIFPWVVNSKQQLLGVADSVGTLHILEVPWTLRHAPSGEFNSTLNYLEREVKRLNYVITRQEFRLQDKRRIDAEEAEKKLAKPVEPSIDDKENKQRMQFLDYKDEEKKFLQELGLWQEPEEPLPET